MDVHNSLLLKRPRHYYSMARKTLQGEIGVGCVKEFHEDKASELNVCYKSLFQVLLVYIKRRMSEKIQNSGLLE